MKYFLLTFLMILFSNSSYAQCKSWKKAKDDNGKKVEIFGGRFTTGKNRFSTINDAWTSSYVGLYNDKQKQISFIQVQTIFKYTPVFSGNQGSYEWYELGSSFELTLENGEKLFFQSTESYLKRAFTTYGIQSAALSEEQLNLIANNKISQIIIYPFQNPDVVSLKAKITDKRSTSLISQFKCFKERNYINKGKVKNPRKALTYMKLADNYIKSNKITKAKEYYLKAIEEFNENNLINSKLSILNVFLKENTTENISFFEKNLNKIKGSKDKNKNLEVLENLVLSLIEKNPENSELENILLLIAK